MPANNTVVTELVVTSNAAAGTSAYNAAMAKAEVGANSVVAANDRMTASMERSTVSMTSSYGRQAAQFTRLAAAVDPVFAAQVKLEKATTSGAAAVAAGRVSQDQYNATLRAYQAQIEGVGVASGVAAAGEAEFAASTAATNRELTVLASEMLRGNFSRLPGSMAVLTEHTNGVRLSFSSLFAIAKNVGTVIFDPVVLAVIGVTAALGALPSLFEALGGSVKSVDDMLKEHEALIKRVRDAYGDAGKAATDYADSEKDALTLRHDTMQSAADLKARFQSEADSVAAAIRASTMVAGDFSGKMIDPTAFGELTKAAVDFSKNINPDTVDAFDKSLLRITNDPSIEAGLKANANVLLDLLATVDQLVPSMHNLAGAMTEVSRPHVPGMKAYMPSDAEIANATAALRYRLQARGLPVLSTKDFGADFDPLGAATSASKNAPTGAISLVPQIGGATSALDQFNNRLQVAQDLSHGFLDTLTTDMAQGKSGIASLTDAIGDLGRQLLKMLTDRMVDNLLTSILGGFGSALFGGGSSAALASPGGMGFALGALHHAGGIVGSPGTPLRLVDASTFDHAPRFHGGLMPDELPAILQRGEAVIPRSAVRASSRSGGGTTVNVQVNNTTSNAEVNVRQEKGPDGTRIFIDMTDRNFASGKHDGVMALRYGLRPKKV